MRRIVSCWGERAGSLAHRVVGSSGNRRLCVGGAWNARRGAWEGHGCLGPEDSQAAALPLHLS